MNRGTLRLAERGRIAASTEPVLFVALVALVFLFAGSSCAGDVAEGEPAGVDHMGEAAGGHSGHTGRISGPASEKAHREEPGGRDAIHAHEHGEADASDLDRSVEELFAAGCEHGIPTYRCAECRYEVGVVEVSPELIEGGLVRVEDVGRHRLSGSVALTGEVRFDQRKIAHLGPRVAGTIRRVHVELGQSVAAGSPLLEIDSPELAALQSAWLEAAAEERLARRAFERQSRLHESNITSEREYREAEGSVASPAVRAESARQTLLRLGVGKEGLADLAEAGLEGAGGRHVVRAPFAGEVLELHAVRGERVGPDTDLLLLGDTGTVWVWADLYERDLASLTGTARTAIPASVHLRPWPEETFHGVLDFVGRSMDETTRTVKARITVENPHGKLRPGMFATVHLDVDNAGPSSTRGGQAKDRRTRARGDHPTEGNGAPADPTVGGEAGAVLAVPGAAVLSDEGRSFVFVRHRENYFVRRPVRTGREEAGRIEIAEGLEVGQTIAVEGAFLLKSDVLRSKMGAGCAD